MRSVITLIVSLTILAGCAAGPSAPNVEQYAAPTGAAIDALTDIQAIHIDCSVFQEDQYRGFAVTVPDIASSGSVCQGFYDEILAMRSQGKAIPEVPVSMSLFDRGASVPGLSYATRNKPLTAENFDKAVARNFESGFIWAPRQAAHFYRDLVPLDLTPTESRQLVEGVRSGEITRSIDIRYQAAKGLITASITLSNNDVGGLYCVWAMQDYGQRPPSTAKSPSEFLRLMADGTFSATPHYQMTVGGAGAMRGGIARRICEATRSTKGAASPRSYRIGSPDGAPIIVR